MYYKLAELLQEPQLYKKSISIYQNIKTEMLLQNTLSSYCVCHGKAGLIYFIKMYENYFNENLNMIKESLIFEVLNFLKNNLKQKAGILEGYTGMILSILSVVKKNCLGRVLLLE